MKQLIIIILVTFSLNTFAQQNGDIISQTLIQNTEELIEYIKQTEGRTEIKLNEERYKIIGNVQLYGITYLSDGLKVNGFLIMPKEKGKFPVIIYNRGGSFDFGSITSSGSVRLPVLARIAFEGYIVVASQYRGNGGSEGREEFGGSDVNDVLNLFPLIDNIPLADNEYIGMYGWSRGGMMSYIVNSRTDRLKAIAVGGALSDPEKSFADRPAWGKYIADSVPDFNKNKKEFIKSRSAISFVDKFPKDVPILMMHGTSDWRVKPISALELATEFDKHRIPYRLIMYEGADHGISEYRQDVYEQIIEWFDRFLKDKEAVPDMKYHGR